MSTNFHNTYKCPNQMDIIFKKNTLINYITSTANIELKAFTPIYALNNKTKKKEILDLSFSLDLDYLKEGLYNSISSNSNPALIEISGPLTIINELIGIKNMFLLEKKDPDLFYKLLDYISVNLAKYADYCINNGVKIISYADTITLPHILGPKLYKNIHKNVSLNAIKYISNTLKSNAKLHICPNIIFALTELNLINLSSRLIPSEISYGQAIIQFANNGEILGANCINNPFYKVSQIKIIKFK